MVLFRFDPVELPPSTLALRDEVREFLAEELASGRFTPHGNSWSTFDADFSRRCGERGFIGMRWPKRYGGRDASALDRHIVIEEMLAAGAPVGAHWIADRQSGNHILANGSDAARARILPRIAAGTCFFAIGLSEPNAGSDLASVAMRAERGDGGWVLNGTKIWTSKAHRAHYLIIGATAGEAGFPPVVSVGFGGVTTEIYHDAVSALAPVAATEAAALLRRLRAYPFLDGFRGRPSADISAAVDVIVRVSECMVVAGEKICEFEINPLIVGNAGRGATAVDILVVPDVATAGDTTTQ